MAEHEQIVDPELADLYAQAAICTEADDCPAGVDEHDENCPVETELRKVFGF